MVLTWWGEVREGADMTNTTNPNPSQEAAMPTTTAPLGYDEHARQADAILDAVRKSSRDGRGGGDYVAGYLASFIVRNGLALDLVRQVTGDYQREAV